MPFPNKDTQFQPGVSGNPAGKPKGTKHLSTHIQNMLEDEDFEAMLDDPNGGSKISFKGAPVEAIIKTAMVKAVNGDDKAREWLAKYGWGNKVTVEMEGGLYNETELTINIVKGDHATIEPDGEAGNSVGTS